MVDFTNTNGDCDFLVILVSNGGYCFSAVKNDQYDVIVQIAVYHKANSLQFFVEQGCEISEDNPDETMKKSL